MKQKRLLTSLAIAVAFLTALTFGLNRSPKPAIAADNDFSDGITVDSTLDTPDDTVGDGICDDGDGNCTLRAAIQEANSNADASTIEFNIAETADFTNGGQNGYTISPATQLPNITEQLTIDGYTQPGSQENTTISPAPFDAVILIEIDGTSLSNTIPTQVACLTILSDQVNVSGLVVNNCGGDAIQTNGVDDVQITGNFIGTDYEGLVDQGAGRDGVGDCIGSGLMLIATNNAQIGGVNPADRNVIGGNQCDDIFITNEDDNPNGSGNNVLQGNYIGLGADGLTPLPAGYDEGLGNGILLGNSHDDLIGGTEEGATNVVASSYEFGISFRDGCSGSRIEGNYIGTDYTGNATVTHAFGTGHMNTAVHIFALTGAGFDASNNIVVGGATEAHRNVISGNGNTANNTWEAGGVAIEDGAYENTVIGNYIGVGADGTTVLGNQGAGVEVYTDGTTDNVIGGTTEGEMNVIANNGGAGVLVGRTLSETANDASILRNSIFDNDGAGIDLGNDGATSNDFEDPDEGPNDMLNFPLIVDIEESGGDSLVDFSLDVPAGSYRVDFYQNTTPDPSGNGEGEEWLATSNVTSNGTGLEQFSYTISGVTGITNIAMTATELDDSEDGFGATSELGAYLTDVEMVKTITNPSEVTDGGVIEYELAFSNVGGTDIDLTGYNDDDNTGNIFADNLILDFLPGNLSFVSSSNPDVDCTNIGGAINGLIFANHSEVATITCKYNGGLTDLAPGEVISTTLTATVEGGAEGQFTNYAITGLSGIIADPNANGILTALGTAFGSGGTIDFIDLLNESQPNNFASATFTPQEDTTEEVENSDEDQTGGLSETGRNIAGLVLVAAGLMTGAVLLRKRVVAGRK